MEAIKRGDSLPHRTLAYGSVAEFCRDVGVARSFAYSGLKSGIIPSIRVGKRFLIPREAVAEWLRNAGRGSVRG